MRITRDPVNRLKDRIRRHGWGISVDETLSFVQPDLAAFHAIWLAKAEKSGGLPQRDDLDMRSLKPYLAHLSVAERVAADSEKFRYRLRLQGSFMAEVFGNNTGKFLDEVVTPDLAERWTCVYDAMLEMEKPLRLQGTYKRQDMEHLIAESLAVPLGNGGRAPVSVLAATYYRSRYRREG
jgi:hypothetical protein